MLYYYASCHIAPYKLYIVHVQTDVYCVFVQWCVLVVKM